MGNALKKEEKVPAMTKEGSWSVWKGMKYRVYDDIPDEIAFKLSAAEWAEVRKGIDKEMQGTMNRERLAETMARINSRPRTFCRACGFHPMFNNEPGLVDSSGACRVPLDVSSLKDTDLDSYSFLLDFQFNCLRNCALELFRHPGDIRSGGVKCYQGKNLEGMDAFRDCAIAAINQYNNLTKKAKLKFEHLIKTNSVHLGGPILYMTFSAMDLETSESSIYEAAVAEHYGAHLLGLLRHGSSKKIMAILSLIGAEKDLAMKIAVVTG